jgi:DNA-binding CsgD family transcriptional regulator
VPQGQGDKRSVTDPASTAARPAPELNELRSVFRKTLTQLCASAAPEHFELRGIQFVIVPEEAWTEAAPESGQRETRLRAVGKLQIQGRQHVILTEQARAQDGAAPRDFLDMLTQRELQIATLVADGWSDKSIARRLTISEYTVREHVRRMFHKANVSKRAALASLVSRIEPRFKR